MVVIINFAGLLIIGLIVWWFWIAEAKSQAVATEQVNQPIEIIVEDGVYEPANIKINAGQDVILRFIRKDASPCAEKVIFAELDKVFELPVNKPLDVKLNVTEPGKYSFTCEMQMYRGSLLVLSAE